MAPPRRLRILLGAFGDPGHAFPLIALGRGLAARGHDVTLETWKRWRKDVEAAGLAFAPAPEYPSHHLQNRPLKPYEAVVRSAQRTHRLIDDLRADVVVADILTLGPALAGECAGVPVATLIPHVYPVGAPGLPTYSIGARRPRTPLGRALWTGLDGIARRGLEQGREELNGARTRLGLPPQDRLHGGLSLDLTMVATFPQLEYPRDWPPGAHVIGPLLWEPPADDVELPTGDGPLVLVAPSTSQDPDQRMLAAALRGLADQPVRVLATHNRRPPPRPLRVPPNARLVEWLSYARTMPHADVVICHAGHGTVVRALSCGCAVVACPVAGDMNENAARLDWSGAGVRLPRRFVRERPLALAVARAMEDPRIRERARELARWNAEHDAAAGAAALIEALAA